MIALPPGIEATGGTTTNIQEGDKNYKVHTFTASGSFVVSDVGNISPNIEYLVVAGGGSGGQNLSGGGGAGGLRTNLSGHPLAAPSYPVSVGTYTVTVGAGGAIQSTHQAAGNPGNDSEFYPNPVSYPNTSFIRAVKGGAGGSVKPAVHRMVDLVEEVLDMVMPLDKVEVEIQQTPIIQKFKDMLVVTTLVIQHQVVMETTILVVAVAVPVVLVM